MLKLNRSLVALWSFVVNVAFWVTHFWMYPRTLKKMKAIRFKNINDIENFMSAFTWTKDSFHDWYPWITTVFARMFHDDCDGAAVMAHWAFAQLGIRSRIIGLYSADGKLGHAICVTNDNMIMTSNERVVFLDKKRWKQNVLDYHNNMFSIIMDG